MIKNKNTKIKANIQAIRPFSRHDLVLFKFGEWKYTRESDLIWFDLIVRIALINHVFLIYIY